MSTKIMSTIKDDTKENKFNIVKARKFYKADLKLKDKRDILDSKKIIIEKDNFINFDITDRIIAQKITEVTVEILNEFFVKSKGYYNYSYINSNDIDFIITSKFYSSKYALPILQTFTAEFLFKHNLQPYLNNQINLLTGQYFSTLILNKLGLNLTIPKNDIDIFIIDYQNRSHVNYENKEFANTMEGYKAGFEDKNIWIKGSEKIQFLHSSIPINFTTIVPEVINDYEYKNLKMRNYLTFFNLLDNFDVNVVKIGLMYDINNNFLTLIIHPDFIEFIKHKQFDYKIKNIHLYEELRIVKKIGEIKPRVIPRHVQKIDFDHVFFDLPFYFDKSKYLKSFLAQEQAFYLLVEKKDKTVESDFITAESDLQSLNFLKPHTAKYYDYLNKYSWVKIKDYKSKIIYLKLNEELIKQYNINNTKYFEIIDYINSLLEDKEKFTLNEKVSYLQLKKLILGCEYISIKKIKKIIDFYIKHKNKTINYINLNSRFDNYGQFLVLYILMQIVINPELLKLDIDKLSFHLNNYIKHAEYRNFYQIFILNIEFIKLIKNSYEELKSKLIKTLSKKEFELYEESLFIKIISFINEKIILKNKYKIDFDVVNELVFKEILEEIEEQNKPLVNYEKIDFTFYDIKVKELYTPLELQTTGNKMHHCVGSYVNNVKEERSVIFQIEHKYKTDLRYTCEINPKTLQVVQIQGFANSPVKQEHKEFIDEIIKIIKQKLAQRYNIDLEKLETESVLNNQIVREPIRLPEAPRMNEFVVANENEIF